MHTWNRVCYGDNMNNKVIAVLAVVLVAAAGVGAFFLLTPDTDNWKNVDDVKVGDYIEYTVYNKDVDTGTVKDKVDCRREITAVDGDKITIKYMGSGEPITEQVTKDKFNEIMYEDFYVDEKEKATILDSNPTKCSKDTPLGKKAVLDVTVEELGVKAHMIASENGNVGYLYEYSNGLLNMKIELTKTNMFA